MGLFGREGHGRDSARDRGVPGRGIEVTGPFPADTVFVRAHRGDSTWSSRAITIRD
jgi:4-hydroxy-L-threonine phosphate dehydrogenase PdxA